MQDTWSEDNNEDIDHAIALSLSEQETKGKNVVGEYLVLCPNGNVKPLSVVTNG